DFLYVKVDLFVGKLGQFLLQGLDLGALLADDQTRTGGEDVDLRLACRALDLDLGDARMIQPFLEECAQLQVLMKELRIVFFRVPFGVPSLDDSKPETYRIYFLTQNFTSDPLAYFFSARTTVMWLVGFLILLARPMARGVKRFSTAPPST